MHEMTLRFKFTKDGESIYLSHLDILKIITRSIARSGIKVDYSMGFNPRPKITFSNPIPLGLKSYAEYCDIKLHGEIEIRDFLRVLNSKLPAGLKVLEAACTIGRVPALMSEISVIFFEFKIKYSRENRGWGGFTDSMRAVLDDYSRISNSIYGYDFEVCNKITGLFKIYGYARIFKEKDNDIFKYNGFYSFLSQYLVKHGLMIESSCKKEAFFFKDDKLITPLEVF